MSIKLKLDGFEEFLDKIAKAEGDVDAAARECAQECADIVQHALQDAMNSKGADSALISRMPAPEVITEGGNVKVKVGYKKGPYNPDNLSDGYKAIFLNYGTPRRRSHGQERARGFEELMRKIAKPRIKAAEEKILSKIGKDVKA